MVLVDRDNQAAFIIVSQTKLDSTDTVYNFTVDEFHTYHVGQFGTWVHNACFDKWGINEHVVTVKHHNWNKIFGDKKVTLDDVNPIIEEALKKGEWKSNGNYLGKKGKVEGERLVLETEVNGNTIWIQAIKKIDGTIIAKNSGVK